MKNNGGILIIGSSNTDMVIFTGHFPVPGETILGGKFLMNPGGKGANQAVAAARSGGKVTFIGKVGKDLFGQQAIQSLKNEGIDVSSVIIDQDNYSGIAQIMVNKNAENCIVVAPGANMALSKEDIDKVSIKIKTTEILLMQLEIPLTTIISAASIGYKAGKKVILNPAPATILPDELYSKLYVITPNEVETEFLTGIKVVDERTAEQAAGILKNKGVKIVVITLGANGAYVYSDDFKGIIPVPKVQAVDTTAAGDTFNGALAVALTEGSNLGDAIKYANHAASISVTRKGAQSSIPYRREIEGVKL